MKLMPKTACDISYAYDAKGRLASAVPVYHYYLQDHLGNNRVVVKQDGTIEQVNHYYPFGGLFGESTNGDVQRFKYNGKELERMHGLDDNSGFKSALYERAIDGVTEYVYATAGTDFESLEDWKNNFLQVVGASNQYKISMQDAQLQYILNNNN